jgi:hypothetical protein
MSGHSAPCDGVQLSGPRRGEPCRANASYAYRGKLYCANHRTIIAASPGEFAAAKDSYYRRLGRAAANADQDAAQLDAFEVSNRQAWLNDRAEIEGRDG